MRGRDDADAYSRERPLGKLDGVHSDLRLGVPRPQQRVFFGDSECENAYNDSLVGLERLGCALVEIDMAPFYETARLLYDGPWVAERTAVVRDLLTTNPDAFHPVTRAVIETGSLISAVDAFNAFYRLEELRRQSERVFETIDMLVLPTAPTAYTVEEMRAEPIKLNSNLGTYTNFVNLLDLCGIAIPASLSKDKLPFGITLLAPGGQDAEAASLGRAFQAETGLPYGAIG
jgi:allophanate hydrolase